MAAAAFAPSTPRTQRDTRRHFNFFGNFGKKVDEKEAVKLAETVDDVGALPTEMEGLTPELDGLRKANALFNQGLISKDEIDDECADTPAGEAEGGRGEGARRARAARGGARARPAAARSRRSAARGGGGGESRRRGSSASGDGLAPDSLMARLAWRVWLRSVPPARRTRADSPAHRCARGLAGRGAARGAVRAPRRARRSRACQGRRGRRRDGRRRGRQGRDHRRRQDDASWT